jgi:hypothetical protein
MMMAATEPVECAAANQWEKCVSKRIGTSGNRQGYLPYRKILTRGLFSPGGLAKIHESPVT